MINVLDLFSGIGGFSLGLKRAGGFRSVAYVEIDKAAREVLAGHADGGRLDLAPLWNDVGTLPRFGGVDLVTAGWPCQGNSIAGKREGMQDSRSGLWGEVVRVLRDFRPQWFLGENVPGLFSVNGGRDFLSCLRDLDDLGYGVCWRVLDAQFFGVPQRRRRVFVVGHLGGPCPPEILFESKGCGGDSQKGGKAGKDVAFSLRANPSRSGDTGDGGINCTMIARPLNSGGNLKHREDMDTLVAGTIQNSGKAAGSATQQDAEAGLLIAAPLTAGSHPNSNAPGRRKEDHVNLVTPPLSTQQRGYGDDQLSGGLVANPVTASYGKQLDSSDRNAGPPNLIHGVRRLTPTECERLQGFPDGWTAGQADSARYRQLGNAVAVPVIEWIGRRILERV